MPKLGKAEGKDVVDSFLKYDRGNSIPVTPNFILMVGTIAGGMRDAENL